MKKTRPLLRCLWALSVMAMLGAPLVGVQLATPGSAFAATPAFVQVKAATPQTAQTSVSTTFTNAEVAGHSNVLAIGWNDVTSSITGVSDTRGNTYQVAVATFRGNGLSQAIYYASNVAAGTDTVTVTFNQPAAFVDLRSSEYANVAAFDVGASATASTGTTASSGGATTTNASDLLLGAGITSGGFTAAGTGYTKRVITSDLDITEDRNVTATGSYAATATKGGGGWIMQLAAFRATVTAPPPPVANFTGTPTSGTVPLNVQFTDTSTGTPTSWSWTFGDGGTSTTQSPAHTYATAGTYTVALTATNAGGGNTLTRTGYITASSGGALSNCWPAPSVCGLPDATNTGVPAGHTLTVVNGDVTLSTANQVYTDREVNGCINVTAANVTIQYVKVHCSSSEAIQHSDMGVQSTPLKVLDSEVDCNGDVGATAIGDTNIDAQRDDVSGCENGFDLDQWDTVKDNWIHDLANSADSHTDGIQLAHYLNGCPTTACEVAHTRFVTIQHNTINGRTGTVNGTSAIINNPTGDESLIVDANLLDGGAYTLYCDHPGTADASSSYTSNRFGRNAAFGPAADCANETNRTGNVYDDDNTAIPLG